MDINKGYYSTIKINKLLLQSTTWVNFSNNHIGGKKPGNPENILHLYVVSIA